MKPSIRKSFLGKVENNYYLGLKDTEEEKTGFFYDKTPFVIVFVGKLNTNTNSSFYVGIALIYHIWVSKYVICLLMHCNIEKI